MHDKNASRIESIKRHTILTMETARLLLTPPHEMATIVFDMSNFSLANMVMSIDLMYFNDY